MSERVDKIILQMLIKAGVDGKATVFLFSDNQIKEESFVEDINMILNTGDVPNIFPADEKADVIEKMQTVARVEVREEIPPVCLIDQLRFQLCFHFVENSIPKLAHKDAEFFGVFHAYYSQFDSFNLVKKYCSHENRAKIENVDQRKSCQKPRKLKKLLRYNERLLISVRSEHSNARALPSVFVT